MKLTKARIVSICAAAMLVAGSAAAVAQPDASEVAPAVPSVARAGGHRMGMGFGRGRYAPCRGFLAHAEELKLTDEQITDLEKLSQESAEAAIDRQARIQKAELKVRTLLDADEIDLDAVRVQLEVAAKERVELRMAHATNLVAVKEILTDEQFKQWRTLRRAGAGRFGRRHGGRGGPETMGREGRRGRRGRGGQGGPGGGRDW